MRGLCPLKIILMLLAGFNVGFSSHPCMDISSWQQFSCRDGRFSILMPGPPAVSLKRDSTPVGEVVSRIYTYENATITVVAEYSDLPGLAVIFGGRRRIYKESISAFLDDVKGCEIGRDKFRLDAYRGIEVVYETPAHYGKARFILIGNRLYVLQAALDKKMGDRSAIDDYFASFKPHYRSGSHARL